MLRRARGSRRGVVEGSTPWPGRRGDVCHCGCGAPSTSDGSGGKRMALLWIDVDVTPGRVPEFPKRVLDCNMVPKKGRRSLCVI